MLRLSARLFPAAAVLAFLIPASAQIVTPGGGGGMLTCSVLNTGNPTQARVQGHSELLGDIVIQCVGGAHSAQVGLTNITVALNNALITSRVYGSGLSEALLTIDEPGAGSAVGAGGTLPQTLCSGGALGAGPGGCETQPGTAGSYVGAVLKSSPSVVPNVFQGVVNGNQVVFNGIPILAPVTAGLARVFRITNIRADAAQFLAQLPSFQGQIPILGSVSMSGGIPLQNPVQTLGFVFNGMGASTVRNIGNTTAQTSIAFNQCVAGSTATILRFAEGFAAGFKSRISPTSALTGAATPPGSFITGSAFTQNMPAQIIPESESAFTLPVTGGTAGLANFGTRLKATFRNVPAGVSIYVSTTNINPLGNGNLTLATANTSVLAAISAGNFARVPGSVEFLAGLVSDESAVAAPGQALPLAVANHNWDGVPVFGPLPVDANGTATAVWEVLLSNPNFLQWADVVVYATSTANTAPLSPPGTVTFGFAGPFADTPASEAQTLITVGPCQTAPPVSLTASANPSTFRQSVTFTSTVTGSPTPTGTVTFKDGAATFATVALASGQASYSTNSLTAGPHSISATYNGDSNYLVASANFTQTVNKAATATALAGPASGNPGQNSTYTATVTSSAGTPTGTVTFRNGAVPIGTSILTGGVATLSTALGIGSHAVTATYNGDTNFLTSTSTAVSTSVNALSTSVSTPVVTSGTPVPGQPLTLSATVTGDGPLTGMLTFRDNGSVIGSAAIDGSGTASVSTTFAAGAHSIIASYSGDVFNGPSTSAPLFLNLRSASTTTITSSLNPATPGAALTFTATVAASSGTAVPTGTVTFTNGATVIGTATLNASAQAALTLASGLTAGEHRIAAAFAGDTNLQPSSSATLVQRVERPATTATLTQSVTNGFTLTAVVAAASGTPSGAVQFRDLTAGATLGAATLANGVASIAVASPLPIGHSVQAVYEGSADFAGSLSTPQPFIAAANGFSFALNFAPDSIVSIFGADLAAATASAPGLPLPTTLGGIEVRLVDTNGRQYPAMLYYVSPGQINFVMPPAVPLGPARLLIVRGNDALSLSITIVRTGPSLTSADGSGTGTAAAQIIRLRRDGSQDGPIAVSSSAVPFNGDRLFLILYGTGMRHAQDQVSCTMNGQPVAVLFAGAHADYPGLDQVNLEIPAALRGLISVSCSTPAGASNTVTLAVQ